MVRHPYRVRGRERRCARRCLGRIVDVGIQCPDHIPRPRAYIILSYADGKERVEEHTGRGICARVIPGNRSTLAGAAEGWAVRPGLRCLRGR